MPETTVPLPDWFVAEVAATRAELDDVAPRLEALAGRYRRLLVAFDPILREANRGALNGYEVPWAASGAQELSDRFDELLRQAAEALELEVR